MHYFQDPNNRDQGPKIRMTHCSILYLNIFVFDSLCDSKIITTKYDHCFFTGNDIIGDRREMAMTLVCWLQ